MRRLPFEYAVRNLSRSPARAMFCVFGSAMVVLLVMTAGAFVRGIERGMASSGSPRNVIVLGAGSEESVERSEISPQAPGLLAGNIEGIRERLGVAFVSPQVHMGANVRLSENDEASYLTLIRGVTPEAFLVHDQVRIVEGRSPQPGNDELLVGRLAGTRMGMSESHLQVDSTLWLDGRAWTISGRFEAPGTVMEAELWCPLTDLQVMAKRDNLSCVVIALEDGGEFEDVSAFAAQRLDLELVAMRETTYYEKLSQFYQPIRVMVWITAVLIGFGALLGGINTMYATFAARVRELAALQTLGFGRAAVLWSLVQESVLAAAVGVLVGAALALVIVDGVAVRLSMGAVELRVDAMVMMMGIGSGLLLGVVGALPPALRCLNLPISTALKAA